jgi:hypothetical protein
VINIVIMEGLVGKGKGEGKGKGKGKGEAIPKQARTDPWGSKSLKLSECLDI